MYCGNIENIQEIKDIFQGQEIYTIDNVYPSVDELNVEPARKIIQEESLQGYNLCEERENRENEVVLKKENEKWIVYVTDERASKIINSVDKYNTEAEAIEDFIERLRADKVLREL